MLIKTCPVSNLPMLMLNSSRELLSLIAVVLLLVLLLHRAARLRALLVLRRLEGLVQSLLVLRRLKSLVLRSAAWAWGRPPRPGAFLSAAPRGAAEHDDKLTSGSRPFDAGSITDLTAALCYRLLTSRQTPLCLSKPFSRKICPRTSHDNAAQKHITPHRIASQLNTSPHRMASYHTCRIQNSDILRAGRRTGGARAAHGRAAGRGSARRGEAGPRLFGAPRSQLSIFLSRATKTTSLYVSSEAWINEILCKPKLLNLKTGHITGGAERGGAGPSSGAAGRVRARRGGARQRRFGTSRRYLSLFFSRAPKTTVLDLSSEARTNEILCKSNRETTSGWRRVLSAGPGAPYASECWLIDRSFFVSVNFLYATASHRATL